MKTKGFIFFLILLFYLPFTVLSEEEKKESKNKIVNKLDEIVITSTQTEKSVMESPSNISVISSEDIKAMDVQNMADLIKKIPGIFYTNGSGLEPKLSLRGTHVGMSPGALVLINGIPMSLGKFGYTDYESIPIETIERIEVVKGPMSSLYGGNSARGVINIITKKDKGNLGGNISIASGSLNDRRASVHIHGSTEKFDFSINAKKKEADGYRDETYLDNYYLSSDLSYWISDSTRFGTYINYTDKERSLAKALDKSERDDDPKQAPDYSLTFNKDLISGFLLETKKQSYDLRSNFYYKYRDKIYRNYLKATSTPYREDIIENVIGIRNIYTLKSNIFDNYNKFSIGIDYDHDDIDMETMKAASKDPLLPYTVRDTKKSGDFTSDKLGISLQEELSILKSLTITCALRYDNLRYDNDAEYDFSEGGTYDYDTTPSFDRFNPRFALNYKLRNSMSLYSSYSQSFRAPSIYDYYASGTYSAENDYTLEPETYTQYEIGYRFTIENFLTGDISIYHLVIDDMLDSAYESGAYVGKQNINQAKMKGLEITISGKTDELISYSLSYSYTEAKYTKDFYTKAGDNINGNWVTKVPKHRINLDLGFTLLKTKHGKLAWNFNYMVQDKYPKDNINSGYYKGYGLVDSTVKFTNERYEVFFGCQNVMDIDYDGYAYTSSGTDYYYPAAGRTFTAGVEYKF